MVRKKLKPELARRRPLIESLESRQMLASDWTNPADNLDVNADFRISALDALQIINELNRRDLTGGQGILDEPYPGVGPRVDVNRSGTVSALDALLVINALNLMDGPARIVSDASGFSTEQSTFITLGQESGRRTYRIDINATFEATGSDNPFNQDVFSIYLVDSANPTKSLYGDPDKREPLFSLTASGARTIPGISRWDGRYIDLDLTSMTGAETGKIILQTLNRNGNADTSVEVKLLSNDVEVSAAGELITIPRESNAPIGPEVDLNDVSPTETVSLTERYTAFNSQSSILTTQFALRTGETGIGRTSIVAFPGLPAGVTLLNPSGMTSEQVPYVNLATAIGDGGLGKNQQSRFVEVQFENLSGVQFTLLPEILASQENQRPVFEPLSAVSMLPGEVLRIPLISADPDNDRVTFSLGSIQDLPTSELTADQQLILRPSKEDVGSYTFNVVASDGKLKTTRELTVEVREDAVTTTRVTGQVLDINQTPLNGLQVELAGMTALTDDTGRFLIDVGDRPLVSDTLRVRGDLLGVDSQYPFVAEKIPFLLGRDVSTGIINQIDRPIYLPKLNTGMVVDPAVRTTVTTPFIEDLELQVEPGTLVTQQGVPFTGELSITEVPAAFTPAALPEWMAPDLVVTIQPGEMQFTRPTPLTLPNRAGWDPGTDMELWSIDPVSGEFAKAGDAIVSEDGLRVETVSGGVRTSSWHVVTPPPRRRIVSQPKSDINPPSTTLNTKSDCRSLPQECSATSTVDVFTGSLKESHTIAPVQVQGQTRSVTLVYDSLRADPRPIFHGGITDSPEGTEIFARVELSRGDFVYQVPGYQQTPNRDVTTPFSELRGGEHFFITGDDTGPADFAIQADLSDFPSGVYDFTMDTARQQQWTQQVCTSDTFVFGGELFCTDDSFESVERISFASRSDGGQFVLINEIGSPYGNGWGIDGLLSLVMNPDGSVLMQDGNGEEEVYQPSTDFPGQFESPAGQFSMLSMTDFGTFKLESPTGQVSEFDSNNRLSNVTDRNGNRTIFAYGENGELTTIIDPIGGQTTFNYSDGKLSEIIDSVGRTTSFVVDESGNLTEVRDADGGRRQWIYDDLRHMTGEIDQLGRIETAIFDDAGRVVQAIKKDGSVISIASVDVQGLVLNADTTDPENPALINQLATPDSIFVDPNGSSTIFRLDPAGQLEASRDIEGLQGTRERGTSNLVVEATNSRGFASNYSYDNDGNLTQASDSLSVPNDQLSVPSGIRRGRLAQFLDRDTYTVDFPKGGLISVDYELEFPFETVRYQLTPINGTIEAEYFDGAFLVTPGEYLLTVESRSEEPVNYQFQIDDFSRSRVISVGTPIVETAQSTRITYELVGNPNDNIRVRTLIGNIGGLTVRSKTGDQFFPAQFSSDIRFVMPISGSVYISVNPSTFATQYEIETTATAGDPIIPFNGTTISLGETVSVDTTDLIEKFQFSIPETDLVTLQAFGDRPNLNGFFLRGPNGTIEVESLMTLVAGDYEISVPDQTVFQIGLVADLPEIAFDVLVQEFFTRSEVRAYRMRLDADTNYRINVNGGLGEPFLDAVWSIYDPVGTLVYRYSGGNSGAYKSLGDLIFSADEAGEYVFELKPEFGSVTGLNTTFLLSELAAPPANEVGLGVRVSDELHFRGDQEVYTFENDTFGNVFVEASRTFPGLSWALSDAQGNLVPGGIFRSNERDGASIQFDNLFPGRYSLRLLANGFIGTDDEPAEYEFKVYNAGLSTQLSNDTPVPTVLGPLSRRVFSFDAIADRNYRISGALNEDTTIRVRSTRFNSDFEVTVSNDQEFTVPDDGRYQIVVANSNDFSTFSFDLTLQEIPTQIGVPVDEISAPDIPVGQDLTPVSVGELVEGQIGGLGQERSAAFSFSIPDEQVVFLDVRSPRFSGVSWSLHQNGSPIFQYSTNDELDSSTKRLLRIPSGESQLQISIPPESNLQAFYAFRLIDVETAAAFQDLHEDSGTIEVDGYRLYKANLRAGDKPWFRRTEASLNGESRLVVFDSEGIVRSASNSGVLDFTVASNGTYYFLFDATDFRSQADRTEQQYTIRVIPNPAPQANIIDVETRVPFSLGELGGRTSLQFELERTTLVVFESDLTIDELKGPLSLFKPNVGRVYRLPAGVYEVSFSNTNLEQIDSFLRVSLPMATDRVALDTPVVITTTDSQTIAISFSAEAGSRINLRQPGSFTFPGSLIFREFYDASGRFLEYGNAGIITALDAFIDIKVDGDYFVLLDNRFGALPDEIEIELRTLLTNGQEIQTEVNEESTLGTTISYDPVFSQPVGITDGRGNITRFEIDPINGNTLSSRRVVGEIDADAAGDDVVTRFTYTASGQLETMTDALDRVSRYEYDDRDRLVTMIDAEGTSDEATTRYEYDAAGNQTAVIDPRGNRTEFEFDAMNRVTTITEADPDGAGPLLSPVTTFVYDLAGNLLSATDATGSTVTYVYDERDQIVSATDNLNQATSYVYDPVGNLREVSDPLGNRTVNSYDGRNRLESSVDPDGGVTLYEYDTDNNMVALTDPVGNRTQFVYDARNRMTEEIDPLGNSTFYVYDAVDNLIEKTDRNDRITTFAYDDLDRLVEETWIDPDGTTIVNTINYEYDKVGNLLEISDQYSHLTYTYDSLNRVTSVDNAGTPDAPNSVLTYTYDSVGNVLTVSDTIDGVAGAVTEYEYDGLNRVKTIKQSGNNVSDKLIDYVYNEIGQYDQVLRYSDLTRTNLVVETDYEYDEINRLADLRHTDNADEVLAFFTYGYDAASRITEITDVNGLTEFAYDNRSQLTEADRADTDPRVDEFYQYDANGNRVASHLHGNGYRTGLANRLLSDGTYDYAYDAEGNMIRRTNIETGEYRVFEWDHRNRLIRVEDFNAAEVSINLAEMTFDAIDRRIRSTSDTDGAGPIQHKTLSFVYDRNQVIFDSSMGDSENKRYLYGPLIDQLELIETTSTLFVLRDHLGSVVGTHGVSVEGGMLEYDSFGQQTEPFERVGFTGREYDESTGLQFNRMRFYAADIGIFLSEDPLNFPVGDLNHYRYGSNDPVSNTDPTGGFAMSYYLYGVLKSTHYNRNSNQSPPDSESEAIASGQWRKLPPEQSVTHQFGEEGGDNVKYVTTDGGHGEAVYQHGGLVTDPTNVGTYNYYGPDNWVGHGLADVAPWLIWGNSSEDKTTGWDRWKQLFSDPKDSPGYCKVR